MILTIMIMITIIIIAITIIIMIRRSRTGRTEGKAYEGIRIRQIKLTTLINSNIMKKMHKHNNPNNYRKVTWQTDISAQDHSPINTAASVTASGCHRRRSHLRGLGWTLSTICHASTRAERQHARGHVTRSNFLERGQRPGCYLALGVFHLFFSFFFRILLVSESTITCVSR